MGIPALSHHARQVLILLSLALSGCTCLPDARLHYLPLTLASLPESMLVGIRCQETIAP